MKRFFYCVIPAVLILIGAGCSSANKNATPLQPATSQGPTIPGVHPAAQPSAQAAPSVSGPSLDLSGQELTSIPSDIFSRTDLVSLDLSNNKLTEAPQAEIGRLENLQTLDLSHNQLTGIPAEIGHLKQLTYLNLSNNQLSGIPLELGNLQNLKVLDITGNPYSKQDMEFIAAKLPHTEIRK